MCYLLRAMKKVSLGTHTSNTFVEGEFKKSVSPKWRQEENVEREFVNFESRGQDQALKTTCIMVLLVVRHNSQESFTQR